MSSDLTRSKSAFHIKISRVLSSLPNFISGDVVREPSLYRLMYKNLSMFLMRIEKCALNKNWESEPNRRAVENKPAFFILGHLANEVG